MLGLIFGIVYIDVDYTVYQGMNSGLGMVFLSTVFIGIVALISGLPMVFEERVFFYRESSADIHCTLVLCGFHDRRATVCGCVHGTLYCCVLSDGGFCWVADAVFYGFNIGLMILFQAYLGQLLVFAFPTLEVGSILGMLINAVSFMLMGFNRRLMTIHTATNGSTKEPSSGIAQTLSSLRFSWLELRVRVAWNRSTSPATLWVVN
ncbi:unnamed protein product [Phytophthora lilii]|uniref:Unnamed protein product n=1 Tax=Phytophthora lilii TaxID=2077276 RepID=A0A9W6TI21_9STRA|nr:unnamed protein product [Phytophthora lilii]